MDFQVLDLVCGWIEFQWAKMKVIKQKENDIKLGRGHCLEQGRWFVGHFFQDSLTNRLSFENFDIFNTRLDKHSLLKFNLKMYFNIFLFVINIFFIIWYYGMWIFNATLSPFRLYLYECINFSLGKFYLKNISVHLALYYLILGEFLLTNSL